MPLILSLAEFNGLVSRRLRTVRSTDDVLIEQAVATEGGVVVRPPGEADSRFAVFARASDAVAAASAMQQALHAEPWSLPEALRVRVALHTGEADLREDGYYGPRAPAPRRRGRWQCV
jgi:class 3 adenylate cyclase